MHDVNFVADSAGSGQAIAALVDQRVKLGVENACLIH